MRLPGSLSLELETAAACKQMHVMFTNGSAMLYFETRNKPYKSSQSTRYNHFTVDDVDEDSQDFE